MQRTDEGTRPNQRSNAGGSGIKMRSTDSRARGEARISIPIAHFVISSGAKGAVEKSLDFTGLVAHQRQDRPNLGSIH